MFKNKKLIALIISLLIIAIVAWWAWSKFASSTKIALVNFQQFQTTSIIKANTDNFVKYEEVSVDDLDKLGKYDFVLAFGMGLQISAEQREQIQQLADKGLPLMIYAPTNPENNICSLDSVTQAGVSKYLGNGNRRNYASFAKYVRKYIDQKSFFVSEPDSVVESASDVLFHLDDSMWFTDVTAYESYLKKINAYTEGGPKVALVGGLNDPFSGNRENVDSLIILLQNKGMNVYPITSFFKRLDYLKMIQPDAVVYFAHGRMAMGQGDLAVEWLKERNIPIFAPIDILQTKAEWESDAMGMFGGFMSQTIVMPELDGTIYPYVIASQEEDKDGLFIFKAIPDRMRNFTNIVNGFINLRRKSNADKKVAIYYFKGPGQSSLTAQGMETLPSLYNLLKRLKAEGYKVDNLPVSEKEFEKLLMTQGAVMSTYAEGAFDKYLKTGKPALIEKSEYESWTAQALPKDLYKQVTDVYGDAPGAYMSVHQNSKDYLAVARILLGNIALLPQPMPAIGNDEFAIVHGAKTPPPHTYIGAYLWSQYDFKADAMLHFGTHGSLEFTPQKQVALSSYDWPDRLVGAVPHFYYYTIGNVGESMMAKRRSYATIVSYLTPSFMESEMRGQFLDLQNKIRDYYKTDEATQPKTSLAVKKIAVAMGLHRDLRLDSVLTKPYSTEDIEKIENFAEEVSNEKMTGQMYTMGVPYETAKINSTVMAMSADPIAYSLANLDKLRGKVTEQQLKSKSYFTMHYLDPAKALVNQILNGKAVNDQLICSLAKINEKELAETKKVLAPVSRMGMMGSMGASSTPSSAKHKKRVEEEKKKSGGGHPSWIPMIGKRPESTYSEEEKKAMKEKEKAKSEASKAPHTMPANAGKAPHGTPAKADSSKKGMPAEAMKAMGMSAEKPITYSKEQKDKARAIAEIERTINNISNYKTALQQSPETEMKSLLNALSGGYVAPSSGGDAIANPTAVPTGRNLYAINAEATPSEVAWDKGVALANATLENYVKQHGNYPQKVSYTFWSSEFIETEGVTIAQVLYMLGVRPVRDAFGRVSDIELIPAKELGRPRVDVVVQTSGQFRDLASSRLQLISEAVELAAQADKKDNFVSSSTTEVERLLVEQGISPKDARELSVKRVFGGINGMYGTNIQGMVTAGDKWESEKEIADTYIHNMGAVYGGQEDWGKYQEGLFRAVLHNTDVVIQPRQSNTWGALSLDHVFEFMGGLNLAVREATGKDPDAYFADYRNRNNVKMQELKEAIGVEARATVFNPAYIKEVMKGQGSSAGQITEVVTNTYAWNVMKPDVIDNEMWDQLYNIYVKDSYNLNVQEYFKKASPSDLQEITAVMLETARKGMWKATDQQLSDVAQLHTDIVKEFGSRGSGMSASNAKLQDYIAQKAPSNASAYKQKLNEMRHASDASAVGKNGKVLKKEQISEDTTSEKNSLNGVWVVSIVLVLFVGLLIFLKKRRKG